MVADVDTLGTLPAREYRAGLGEVAKYALIAPPSGDRGALAELVEADAEAIRGRDPDVLTELVCRVRRAIKADVRRRAIRRSAPGCARSSTTGTRSRTRSRLSGDYDDLLHGEAVAVGLVFAGELGGGAGARRRFEPSTGSATLVSALGLPIVRPTVVDAATLLELMRRDKKAKGGLTFVLPGPNGIERVDDPPAAALERAFEAVGVEG